jgi:ATP-dependent RNA helicase DeaD
MIRKSCSRSAAPAAPAARASAFAGAAGAQASAEVLLNLAGTIRSGARRRSRMKFAKPDHERMLKDTLFSEETTSDDGCRRRPCSPSGRRRTSPRRWRGFYRARLPSPEDIPDPGQGVAGPARIAPGRSAVRRGDDRNRAAIEEGKIIAASRHGRRQRLVPPIGSRKKVEARWLLPMICRRGGIDSWTSRIRIMDTTTEFEISPALRTFTVKVRRPDKEDNIRIEALGDAPPREELCKQERTPQPHGKTAKRPTGQGPQASTLR